MQLEILFCRARVSLRNCCYALALLGAAGLAGQGCGKAAGTIGPKNATPEGIAVTVAAVVEKPLDLTIPVVGTLFPIDEAIVSAEVEGRVERTRVDLGARLEAGQELVQIDTASFNAQAQLAAANVAKAQANWTNAQHNLKRTEDLSVAGIASPSDLDTALALANQWRAEVGAAEALAAIAQLNLGRSRVKTPFISAVAERLVSAGDYVKIGTPLYRIVNDSRLKFISQAPERYAGHVKQEQLVRFTVDAYPGETFTGRVYLISPQINTVNRSFQFGALVPNSERRLKAKLFGRGELLVQEQVPTLVVPLEAVLNFAGVTKVFVAESGKARSQVVRTGPIRNGEQQIVAGLKGGESVVVSGVTKLYDGARIRLQPATPPASAPAPGPVSAPAHAGQGGARS
jgi:RND family efflux transporter MFP subunit